jgi:hypothetical protein
VRSGRRKRREIILSSVDPLSFDKTFISFERNDFLCRSLTRAVFNSGEFLLRE